jgi:hypothetical protein
MALSHLRRTATAAALVTATAALALPTLTAAPAASATDRAATSLAIRAVHSVVRPGDSDTITGALAVSGPGTAVGRTVTLEARPMGSSGFTPVAESVAGDHGGIRASITPDVTTRYRWEYAGDTDARPSVSGVATVRVRTPQHPAHRLATSLSIRAVHRLVGTDGTDVVRGRLRAGHVPLRGRRVVLVSRTADDTAWTFDGVHRTRRLGVVAFRVEPAADTAYRLVFLGTPLLQPARSASVRVVTRPDVAITAAPRSIVKGETTTVTGTVADAGAPVSGGTVELWGRRVGSTRDLHLVASGTTADDGTVAFTESPAAPMVYRLRLLRSTGLPGALSDRTRVWVRYPTSLSIRGRAHDTTFHVTGLLRGHGRPLGHRPVTLQAQLSGSATWTDVDTARTGAKGVARFERPLAPGTGYRLAYAGGRRFAPSLSGTVVS